MTFILLSVDTLGNNIPNHPYKPLYDGTATMETRILPCFGRKNVCNLHHAIKIRLRIASALVVISTNVSFRALKRTSF